MSINIFYFKRRFLISIFQTSGKISKQSWISKQVQRHETTKSETRRQWRVGSEKEQWKGENENREKERDRENTDGIGRRVVNGNDGHRLSQRRLIPILFSLPSLDLTKSALSFALLPINIKPFREVAHSFFSYLSLLFHIIYTINDIFLN